MWRILKESADGLVVGLLAATVVLGITAETAFPHDTVECIIMFEVPVWASAAVSGIAIRFYQLKIVRGIRTNVGVWLFTIASTLGALVSFLVVSMLGEFFFLIALSMPGTLLFEIARGIRGGFEHALVYFVPATAMTVVCSWLIMLPIDVGHRTWTRFHGSR
ncbi:MAG: hypothetical protein HY897_21930 [Deltaproteobacteria bacterium]|nr:hypothetical protein [Deltaproteobacteria bacterium]